MSAKRGIICYRIFSRAYFHLPFLALYLHDCGYGIVQITVLLAVYGGASFLFGLLTGRKKPADKINDKFLLIISEAIKIVGLLLLAHSHQAFGLAAGQIFLGLSFGLPGGADSRILYDYVDEPGFQERSSSYMFLSLLISGLIGSAMFQANPRLPFYGSVLAAVMAVISCAILLPKGNKKRAVSEKAVRENKKEKLSVQDKQVLITYSLFRGIILSFFSGILPYYLGTELNLGIYSFALVLAGYTVAGNLAAKVLGRLPDGQKKYQNGIRCMAAAVFLALLLFWIRSVFVVALATVMLGIAAGISRPLCFMKVKMSGNLRNMSGKMETAYSAVNIIVLLSSGVLYKYYSLHGVLLFLLCLWMSCVFIINHKKYSLNVSYDTN